MPKYELCSLVYKSIPLNPPEKNNDELHGKSGKINY